MSKPHRCAWAESDPLLRDYHDQEWGVPQYDSRALWELLMLEGFQAGLAWITVLRKREAFRRAFRGFEPKKVSRFAEPDIIRLLADPGLFAPAPRSRRRFKARAFIRRWRAVVKASPRLPGNWLGESRSRTRPGFCLQKPLSRRRSQPRLKSVASSLSVQ